MVRRVLLAAASSARMRRLVTAAPLSRRVVARFVAGSTVADALRTVRTLGADGLAASLDYLGEETRDTARAEAAVRGYLALLDGLGREGLGARAEISVKLTALGLDLDRELALGNALRVCRAASEAGTTVTVDMEDSTRTSRTLEVVAALRRDHPDVGAVLQAYLRRTEQDCRALAVAGSRVRLCKGAYREPPSVAFQHPHEVRASYARCLALLMNGPGYPMVATHEPVLLALAERLAARTGRDAAGFEYQMLHGVRPDEQRRLARSGAQVRVYVPFGDEWYPYLMRRLAERPANLALFLRALAGRA